MNGDPVCTEDCNGPCVIIIGGETARRAECFVQVQYELEEKGTPVPEDDLKKFKHALKPAYDTINPIVKTVLERADPAVRAALELQYGIEMLYQARDYGVYVSAEEMQALADAAAPANDFMAVANQQIAHRQPVT